MEKINFYLEKESISSNNFKNLSINKAVDSILDYSLLGACNDCGCAPCECGNNNYG